jgi:hypothetical protein
MFNVAGFLILSIVVFLTSAGLANRRTAVFPASLVLTGVVLRIFGATVRYEVLFRFYRGVGDSVAYYRDGLKIAKRLWEFDLSALGTSQWFSGSWWGTPFLENISGLMLSLIGPTLRGEFLTFSILSFAGLYGMARAIRIYHPGFEGIRYARWLWLWPSLWFWPSSVGKEAMLILGIGLFVYGYATNQRAMKLVFILFGGGLTFAVRPHVAAALALSMAAAHWIGSWTKFSLRQGAELVLAVVIAFFAFNGMVAQFGLETADLEGMV